jgi:hypothetical protein
MTEPTKRLETLASFVSKAIESYKGKFTSFCVISVSKADNGSKLHQATMHISDIASLIAIDYQRVYADMENNPELCFNIASQLVADSRVGKAMGLSDKLWDDITALKQLENAGEYNGFVAMLQNRDQQKKEMSGCC